MSCPHKASSLLINSSLNDFILSVICLFFSSTHTHQPLFTHFVFTDCQPHRSHHLLPPLFGQNYFHHLALSLPPKHQLRRSALTHVHLCWQISFHCSLPFFHTQSLLPSTMVTAPLHYHLFLLHFHCSLFKMHRLHWLLFLKQNICAGLVTFSEHSIFLLLWQGLPVKEIQGSLQHLSICHIFSVIQGSQDPKKVLKESHHTLRLLVVYCRQFYQLWKQLLTLQFFSLFTITSHCRYPMTASVITTPTIFSFANITRAVTTCALYLSVSLASSKSKANKKLLLFSTLSCHVWSSQAQCQEDVLHDDDFATPILLLILTKSLYVLIMIMINKDVIKHFQFEYDLLLPK